MTQPNSKAIPAVVMVRDWSVTDHVVYKTNLWEVLQAATDNWTSLVRDKKFPSTKK